MVATKSVEQNNKVTVTSDSSLYYSSLAKTYADEAKIAESNITELLESEKISTINNNMEAINTLVQNISGIKQVSENMGAINSIKNDSERLFNEIKQVGFYRKGKHLYYKDDENNEVEFKSYSFVPGTIYHVTGKIDESENLFRYANGQVVIEDDSIKGLTVFLDKQEKLGNTSIFCTEEEWQAEKTLSKFGQCGKYVRDKEAGTLRLPAIVNLQGVMDLTNVGVTKDENLPNVKGLVAGIRRTDNLQSSTDSALYWLKQNYSQKAVETAGTASTDIAIDLSRNNSTYQDNAPVQQEAIQYPYVICVNSGTAEEPDRPINNYMVNNPFSFGVSQYYKGEMNNLSWLRSNGQKNYKAVYPDFYNWALGQLNASVEGFKNHTDENITDYDFVINQTDESFILPLKNGMEGVFASGTVLSGYNLYFFVGETMQNSNLANLGRLEETLVDKVDTDLNNMNPSQTVKKTFLSWELPDYSAGVATLTAPCEGWFNVNTIVVPNGSMYETNINGVKVETYSAPSGAVRVTGSMYRVSEGDVIVSTGNVQFFPCKGVSNV